MTSDFTYDLMEQTLKQVLPIMENLRPDIKANLIRKLYTLNKALNYRNAVLNVFFCRRCFVYKSEDFLGLKPELLPNVGSRVTSCCHKKVTLDYKYKALIPNFS